ncbi:hypothetical protein [Bacillus sp. FJAT-50079]|uniref:hypothetical protein n=1 Tax=Bacillus sp. FJAT-50079 TaxID=2833577 RepID=UPI001BC9EEB4|nr:hypothetical protein [Bacillus sp. FJAT-50079]MBS4210645.1 hypothetical protein [Bacillus sp. FJAT-50079]
MKKAIVFAARQPIGFKACVQLLDQGLLVDALDHEMWQTERHVEQWMLIGRNANLTLTLYNDENEGEMERFDSIPINYVIIPLIDYYEKGDDRLQIQLIRLVEMFYQTNRCDDTLFIFLQPTAMDRSGQAMYEKIEMMKEQLKQHANIIEYFITNHTLNYEKKIEALQTSLPEVDQFEQYFFGKSR